MPTSPTHQNFLLLFRRHPELTFELARRAGAPLPRAYQRFEEVSGEFDDPLQPGSSVRADLAMLGHLRQGKRRGLVLEVQLDIDLNRRANPTAHRRVLERRRAARADRSGGHDHQHRRAVSELVKQTRKGASG